MIPRNLAILALTLGAWVWRASVPMPPPSMESLDSTYFDRYRLILPYADGGPSKRIENARRFTLPPAWLDLPVTQASLARFHFFLDGVRVEPLLGTWEFSERAPISFDRPGSTDFLVFSRQPFGEIRVFRRTVGFQMGATAQRMASVPVGFLFTMGFAALILYWCLGRAGLSRTQLGALTAVGLTSAALCAAGVINHLGLGLCLGVLVATGLFPCLLRGLRRARTFWLAPDEPRPLAAAGILFLVAFVVTIPHAVLGAFWRPGSAGEDSIYYLFTAARFFRDPNPLCVLTDPGTWTYTGFSLVMALPWTLGLHPMTTYLVMAVLGPSLLVWSIATLITVACRSIRAGIIGAAIAALWGGLEGFLWLLAGLKNLLVSNRSMRLPESDYHDPGFLGEYAGPHSELVSYLALPPLYPREAALIPFWLGLALLYRANGARDVWGGGALFLLSTFFYPHYAAPSAIALFVALLRFPTKRKGSTAVALVLMSLGLAVVANGLVSAAMGSSLAENLMNRIRWPRATVSQPSVEFALPRAISVLVPFAVLCAIAVRSRRRPTGEEPLVRQGFLQLLGPTFLAGLAWSLFAAALWTFRRGTVPDYTWLVTWRGLVAPTLLASSSLLVLGLAKDRSKVWVALLFLLPAVSPAVFVAGFLQWQSREPRFEEARERYERFRELGGSWLGRAAIKEPILFEGPPGEGDYLQAALGIWVWNTEKYAARKVAGGPNAVEAILAPSDGAELRLGLELAGIGEVWVPHDSPRLFRLWLGLNEVGRLGPYIRLSTAPL